MNNINKIFLVIITILIIALAIITYKYFVLKETCKKNLDDALHNAELTYEAHKRIHELEDELEQYKK